MSNGPNKSRKMRIKKWLLDLAAGVTGNLDKSILGELIKVKAWLKWVQKRKRQQASDTTNTDNYLKQSFAKGEWEIETMAKTEVRSREVPFCLFCFFKEDGGENSPSLCYWKSSSKERKENFLSDALRRWKEIKTHVQGETLALDWSVDILYTVIIQKTQTPCVQLCIAGWMQWKLRDVPCTTLLFP